MLLISGYVRNKGTKVLSINSVTFPDIRPHLETLKTGGIKIGNYSVLSVDINYNRLLVGARWVIRLKIFFHGAIMTWLFKIHFLMFYCFVDILKRILHIFNVMFCRDNALLVDLGNINSVEVRANFGSTVLRWLFSD